tara:strand:+ start:478 stop:1092 length:615 start_codon:yes stop_codon:yes gene_type:complete
MSNIRPYIPSYLNENDSSNNYTFKSGREIGKIKPPQSYSRDKHNKVRAANHRLNKKKTQTIFIYQNKPLLVFKLLEEGIHIKSSNFKKEVNHLLENYEIKIRLIDKCNNEKDIDKLCGELNLLCTKIEKLINCDTFINYLEKGYFLNCTGENIKNDDNYNNLIEEIYKSKSKIVKKIKNSEINANISFAEMLKRNIKSHDITEN